MAKEKTDDIIKEKLGSWEEVPEEHIKNPMQGHMTGKLKGDSRPDWLKEGLDVIDAFMSEHDLDMEDMSKLFGFWFYKKGAETSIKESLGDELLSMLKNLKA